MLSSNPFKWRHFQSGIILLTVRWYLRSMYRTKSVEVPESLVVAEVETGLSRYA